MSLTAALALAATLVAAPSGQQRDWPSSQGFNVLQLDQSCAITTTYDFDGRSSVELSLFYQAEEVTVLLTSTDWSNREGETYDVSYLLGDRGYTGGAAGLVTSGRPGFVAKFDVAFLDAFAAAPSLMVTRGDAIITHLSLSGSGAAVSTLRHCLEHVMQANAAQARREQRWDYIAADPFAPPAPTPAENPPLAVITNVSWARAPVATMPQSALDLGLESGVVRLDCRVEANGGLADCFIASESPAGAGLGEAALSASTRARMSPIAVDSAAPGARTAFEIRYRAADRQP